MSDLLGRYFSALIEDGRDVFLPRLPSTGERLALQRRQDELSRALRPAAESMTDCDRIAAAVTLLLSTYFSAKSDDPKGTVAAFVVILRDLPVWAVEDACLKIGRGLAPHIKREFPPSAASIHDFAADLMANVVRETVKISQVLRAVASPERREPTPEEKARVQASLDGFRTKMAAAIGDGRSPAARQEREAKARAAGEARIEREYRAAGLEPLRAEGIGLISLGLARALGAPLRKAEDAA